MTIDWKSIGAELVSVAETDSEDAVKTFVADKFGPGAQAAALQLYQDVVSLAAKPSASAAEADLPDLLKVVSDLSGPSLSTFDWSSFASQLVEKIEEDGEEEAKAFVEEELTSVSASPALVKLVQAFATLAEKPSLADAAPLLPDVFALVSSVTGL